jgi:hypothetical protein
MKNEFENVIGLSDFSETIQKSFAEFEILEKAKYLRREGSKGNYKYIYKENEGRGGAAKTEGKKSSSSILPEKLSYALRSAGGDLYQNYKKEVKSGDAKRGQSFEEYIESEDGYIAMSSIIDDAYDNLGEEVDTGRYHDEEKWHKAEVKALKQGWSDEFTPVGMERRARNSNARRKRDEREDESDKKQRAIDDYNEHEDYVNGKMGPYERRRYKVRHNL